MSITARIRVEVEVTVGVWSESCSMTELKDQVKREGRQIVVNSLKGHGRIVGEPKVILIAAYEQEESQS